MYFVRMCHGNTNASDYFLNNFQQNPYRELRFSPMERGDEDASNRVLQVFLILFSEVFLFNFLTVEKMFF